MKILIAPDKFKGSLTSFEVCNAVRTGLKKVKPAATVLEFPMADGGDGFAAIMKYYLHTDTIYCDTVDPLGRNMTAFYEWDEKNKTAIIEMAVASGLVLLKENERNPLRTSTFGSGLLIKDAITKGARKIILGLGGSATTDAGIGILVALGFQLINDKNELLQPSGENLCRIKSIVVPPVIPDIQFEIACDVHNVLYGRQGAAYVYAPQKGANEEQVKQLDAGLKNFADRIKEKTGKDVAGIPGTGAAGGIAAGLLSFFNVELKKGIEMIVDASKIKEHITDVNMLITGEGKLDEQSGEGKVVGYMAALARQHNIPCIAVCGQSGLNETRSKKMGLQKVIPIKDDVISTEEAMANAGELLTMKVAEYFTAL